MSAELSTRDEVVDVVRNSITALPCDTISKNVVMAICRLSGDSASFACSLPPYPVSSINYEITSKMTKGAYIR
jgi:hypothetical protein